jgi:hypothetical protein
MLRQWIWRDFANILIGVWLIASPSALGYTEPAMIRSDIASGAVIVVAAALALSPRFDLARWVVCLAGIWLLFAPLLFWTRDPAAYANGNLAGALVIAFSVLIPMMPSRVHHRVMTTPGPDIPPGWSYNPSDWIQRGPIIAMAFVGFFLSRYLAAYQLGHIGAAWDPIFGDGTVRVLDSDVSRAWPVSDAGLGAASYMLEALSGFMGARNRWRTMPWMVVMFGVLVVPLGIVSLVLVMLQPIAVGAWCTLCLITAAAMLIMVSPALDEVIAMVQFLKAARREGQPVWTVFWTGGSLKHHHAHAEPHEEADGGFTARRLLAAMDLDRVPWTLLVAAGLGVWLMAAPAVLGAEGRAANVDYLAGALIVTWSVVGFAEVARPARLLNLPVALAVLAATFMVSGGSDLSRINDVVTVLIVAGLSVRRGRIRSHFGAWNRMLV